MIDLNQEGRASLVWPQLRECALGNSEFLLLLHLSGNDSKSAVGIEICSDFVVENKF